MKLSTPFLPRHHHVKEADVDLVEAEGFDGLLAVIGDDDLVIVHGEKLGQRIGVFGIVIDDQYIEGTRHRYTPVKAGCIRG